MTTKILHPGTHHRSGFALFNPVVSGGAQPPVLPRRSRVRYRRNAGDSREYFRAMRAAEMAVWRAVRASQRRLAHAAALAATPSTTDSNHH